MSDLVGGPATQPKRTCHQCRFLRSDLGDGRTYCTRNPPTAFFQPAYMTPTGAVGPQTISSYVPVNPEVPCGEFRDASIASVVRPFNPGQIDA